MSIEYDTVINENVTVVRSQSRSPLPTVACFSQAANEPNFVFSLKMGAHRCIWPLVYVPLRAFWKISAYLKFRQKLLHAFCRVGSGAPPGAPLSRRPLKPGRWLTMDMLTSLLRRCLLWRTGIPAHRRMMLLGGAKMIQGRFALRLAGSVSGVAVLRLTMMLCLNGGHVQHAVVKSSTIPCSRPRWLQMLALGVHATWIADSLKCYCLSTWWIPCWRWWWSKEDSEKFGKPFECVWILWRSPIRKFDDEWPRSRSWLTETLGFFEASE